MLGYLFWFGCVADADAFSTAFIGSIALNAIHFLFALSPISGVGKYLLDFCHKTAEEYF